jgi:cytochrome c-type biogenesis protein
MAGTQLHFGVLPLVFYGLGQCVVIMLAGTSTGLVQQYVNWDIRSRGAQIVKRIRGALVLVGGMYFLHTAP